MALRYSLFYFFLLFRSLSPSLCAVLDAVSPNVVKVFSNNPSANVSAFENFKADISSGGTGSPGEFYYQFFYLKLPFLTVMFFCFNFCLVSVLFS